MKKYLALLLVLPAISIAKEKDLQSQAFFKYGVGIFGSAQNSAVEVKTISVGKQGPLGSVFIYQLELGGWTDIRSDAGRKGNAFINEDIGVNVNAGYIYIQSLWGIAQLANTDSYLGARLEFNQDFSVGLKDPRGVSVGVNYKHISSAGIFMPNQGRDFFSVRLGMPF